NTNSCRVDSPCRHLTRQETLLGTVVIHDEQDAQGMNSRKHHRMLWRVHVAVRLITHTHFQKHASSTTSEMNAFPVCDPLPPASNLLHDTFCSFSLNSLINVLFSSRIFMFPTMPH